MTTTKQDTENRIHRQICYGLLDVDEARKTNMLISGSNNTGKTNLACNIVSVMQRLNWKVIVFDGSGAWLKQSDIPIYYTVQYDSKTEGFKIPLFNDSVLYDLRLLLPSEQKIFVNTVLLDLWHRQLEAKEQVWWLVVLEEQQLYCKNVRSEVSENILRIMSVGRNQRIRVLGVTPDLALIDSAFIRLSGQRWHGRLSIEENGQRKFRYYYGSDWLRVTKAHDLGYFTYLNKDKLKVVNIGYFETLNKPKDITGTLRLSILQKIKSLIYNRRLAK